MSEVDTAKMSERGQVIIPKDIRDYIGATEHTIFTVMSLDKETIVMKKLDKLKILEEFQKTRESVKQKMSPQEIQKEIEQVRKQKNAR